MLGGGGGVRERRRESEGQGPVHCEREKGGGTEEGGGREKKRSEWDGEGGGGRVNRKGIESKMGISSRVPLNSPSVNVQADLVWRGP